MIGLRPKAAGTRPAAPRTPRAAWHAVANGAVLAWLALTAVAALVHHELPAPRWLLIHLFLLGAVTNAIVTWTEHFAAALLRVPQPPRWWPVTRLGALNAGIAAVLCGVAEGLPLLAAGGAATVVTVVAAHVTVLAVRGRRALGGRFAHVVGWYVWSGAALVAGGGLLADLRWLAAAGLLLYAAAAALALVPFVRTLIRRHPHTPASWMLAAGTTWFAVILIADAARQSLGGLLPLVLVGFVGQTLLGALTFLLPVVLGGGPAALKANAAVIERLWTPRLVAVNVAVPLLVLPVPDWLTRAGWIVTIAALGTFVLLAAATVIRSHRPSPVVAGITAGVLLTALAVGVAAGNGTSPSTVAATGTRTVDVTLADMRIRPGTIEAEPGTRLVLRVTNRTPCATTCASPPARPPRCSTRARPPR